MLKFSSTIYEKPDYLPEKPPTTTEFNIFC